MIGVGDMYVDQEVKKVKNYVQHLSQALAVIHKVSCIRDLSPTGSLPFFEPGDKVLLKTWKTGSPEHHRRKVDWTLGCLIFIIRVLW